MLKSSRLFRSWRTFVNRKQSHRHSRTLMLYSIVPLSLISNFRQIWTNWNAWMWMVCFSFGNGVTGWRKNIAILTTATRCTLYTYISSLIFNFICSLLSFFALVVHCTCLLMIRLTKYREKNRAEPIIYQIVVADACPLSIERLCGDMRTANDHDNGHSSDDRFNCARARVAVCDSSLIVR